MSGLSKEKYMGLTKTQVLEDAEELVVDLLSGLSVANLTPQTETLILADAKKILESAAKIIDIMVLGRAQTVH